MTIILLVSVVWTTINFIKSRKGLVWLFLVPNLVLLVPYLQYVAAGVSLLFIGMGGIFIWSLKKKNQIYKPYISATIVSSFPFLLISGAYLLA